MPHTTASPSRSLIGYFVSRSQNFFDANIQANGIESYSCRIHAAIPTSDASVRKINGFSRSGNFSTGAVSRAFFNAQFRN